MMKRFRYLAMVLLLALQAGVPLSAQTPNKRLILKDGSYQVVRQYEVTGDRVRYQSAERAGGWEELPKDLVDWPATEKWAREHVPGAQPTSAPALQAAAELDKEEQQERAETEARMPEVAPGLRLPDEDGVFALDTFHGKPELVTVLQSNGDLAGGHHVLSAALNPLAGTRQEIRISGAKSKVQLHVNEPVLYVSIDTPDEEVAPESALKVQTHGAGSVRDKSEHSSPGSRYAIVRAQVKKDQRTVATMSLSMLGKVTQSEQIIETTAEILPGRHWMKLTPKQPLEIGEYALMEIISPKEVNLAVWDFRVDPTAPENANARLPVQQAK